MDATRLVLKSTNGQRTIQKLQWNVHSSGFTSLTLSQPLTTLSGCDWKQETLPASANTLAINPAPNKTLWMPNVRPCTRETTQPLRNAKPTTTLALTLMSKNISLGQEVMTKYASAHAILATKGWRFAMPF